MKNNCNGCVTGGSNKQQIMCDTLSKNHINSLLNYKPLAFSEKDICETDNTQRKSPDLKLESERIKTFENWDNNSVTPHDLAKVGLYYSPPVNKVKCAFCDAEISPHSFGECALDDHLRASPFCPFARAKKGQRTLSTYLRDLPPDQDVCGNVDTFSDTVRFLSKIAHPFDDFNSRLQSFENWPTSSKQKPEKLAEAGFYYRGEGDKTVCFRCSGPLTGWEDDDDPWEQHALWYPKCKFLLEEKGQGFVDQVHEKLKPTIEWDVCEDGPGGSVDEDKMCIVCCSSQKGAVLVPCGHDWTCVKCIGALEDKKCPVCREQIVNVRRL